MRVRVIAVGRSRAPEIDALFAHYARRCSWPLDLVEVVAKKPGRDAEAQALLRHVPAAARAVILDERGRDLGSAAFAARLAGWRDAGLAEIVCLIGGPDGHGKAVHERADLVLAFGRMTWPHLLVRAMLAEQVYRASSILSGHPYHRG